MGILALEWGRGPEVFLQGMVGFPRILELYDRDATLPGSSGWGHNNLAIPSRLPKGEVVSIQGFAPLTGAVLVKEPR